MVFCLCETVSPKILFLLIFFFFKQKTAYEMRISDWSSDVCSSDLAGARALQRRAELPADSLEEFCAERLVELATDRRADLVIDLGARRQSRTTLRSSSDSARRGHDDLIVGRDRDLRDQIGSASCRERVCQYG